MAAIRIDTVQTFYHEGVEIESGRRIEVSAELARQWINEGKAMPVLEEKAAVIEIPEDRTAPREHAAMKRKKR